MRLSMIGKRIFISLTLLVMINCSFFQPSGKDGNLKGRIFITGNEPFTRLALKDRKANVYYLQCEKNLKEQLWELQGKAVIIYYVSIDSNEAGKFVQVKDFKVLHKE
jgi:hypothetical protein